MKTHTSLHHRGFSLIEMITAVGIVGIILFLAIPNVIRVREDSEISLAIARTESINMAVSSYIQAKGRVAAQTVWATKDNSERYGLIKPYLMYAPNSLTDYIPSGYTVTMPTSLASLSKARLFDPGNTEISY